MRRRRKQAQRLITAFAAVWLLITGSALAQTPDSTATPSPGASPAAGVVSATANAELGEIEWAREIDPVTNEPVRRATGFVTTDPAIHAAIPVIRILQGTVVSATWTFNGEPVPALDASVTADHSYENGWITFSLVRPEDAIWPIGEYGITILVDGVKALTSDVRVQVPPA